MMTKTHSRAYNRDASRRKALSRRRLDEEINGTAPQYDNLHQYSKNKIYVSYDYNEKTRNKGRRNNHPANYDRSINYKASDLRRVEEMNDAEKDIAETEA